MMNTLGVTFNDEYMRKLTINTLGSLNYLEYLAAESFFLKYCGQLPEVFVIRESELFSDEQTGEQFTNT
jgi:hypothetical protein